MDVKTLTQSGAAVVIAFLFLRFLRWLIPYMIGRSMAGVVEVVKEFKVTLTNHLKSTRRLWKPRKNRSRYCGRSTATQCLEEVEMTKKLVSLRSYNARHRRKPDCQRRTGIACPKCGTGLLDVEPLTVRGVPPMVKVICPRCGLEKERAG